VRRARPLFATLPSDSPVPLAVPVQQAAEGGSCDNPASRRRILCSLLGRYPNEHPRPGGAVSSASQKNSDGRFDVPEIAPRAADILPLAMMGISADGYGHSP